jgi:hypothetical protein
MFPWGAMLRAALSTGIAPEAFWRLSLREWRWLAAQGDGMSRGRLADLMGAFPDAEENPPEPPLSPPFQGGERRQRILRDGHVGVPPSARGRTGGGQAAGDAYE